jgi:gliding motility-associated-like protein
MEARKKMSGEKMVLIILFYLMSVSASGQYCDGDVPSFNVDLSANPEMSWTSPLISRDGNCCSTSNPDRCLEFVLTLSADAISVNFIISSGAIPPGALFYQINCGPEIPVGSPICISGPGPHHLTFCKPGNNANTFSIQSFPEPLIGPDLTLCPDAAGFIFAEYYNESSMTWTSVAPGITGEYNNLLDCTIGCDTVLVSANGALPSVISYQVCGTDLAGCLVDPVCETIDVTILPETTISLNYLNNVLCNGQSNGSAEITVSGGIEPYDISWNTIPAQNGALLTGVSAGTYTATVTDANGCVQSYDVTITEPAPLSVQLGTVPPSCFGGTNGAISTDVNGGTPLYSYDWSNNAVSSNIYGLSAGNYSVTITDANGCMVFAMVDLLDPPGLQATITEPIIACPGTELTLTITASGGSGNLNYLWQPDGENTSSINVDPSVNTDYSVVVTDDNGCSIELSTSINMISFEADQLQASVDQTVICAGTSVVLSAQFTGDPTGVTLSWENCPACPTDSPLTLNPLTSTSYILHATNACGQTISDTVHVQVNALPAVTIILSDASICPSESVQFSVNGASGPGWSYQWNFGDGTGSTLQEPVHSYAYQGFYPISLHVTDPNGCSSSLDNAALVTVHAQALASFTVSATETSTLDGLISMHNYSLNANSFSWNFGDGATSALTHPSHTYEEAGYFQITLYATNDFGCNDSTFITVHIEPSFELFVPNTFTPDGDYYNNTFFAQGFGISDDDFIFRIFNRWGDLIFESYDMDEGWEGTDKRNLNKAQDGTYTWVVYFKDGNNRRHRREGHVNVLK